MCHRFLNGGPAGSEKLFVKIWVQHAYLRDGVHGQIVALGSLADGLRRRGIVDAEGLLLVRGDVRMNPGHIVLQVVPNHGQANIGALAVSALIAVIAFFLVASGTGFLPIV
jgi:hypothetical protein